VRPISQSQPWTGRRREGLSIVYAPLMPFAPGPLQRFTRAAVTTSDHPTSEEKGKRRSGAFEDLQHAACPRARTAVLRRVADDGPKAGARVMERGHEGSVAKDPASTCRGGRTRHLRKWPARVRHTVSPRHRQPS